MDLFKSSGRPRGRSIALLVAGLLAGTVLIQPAVAHVTRRLNHLTKHLDKRYVRQGQTVDNASTVDGFSANELVRGAYATTPDHIEDFAAPTYTDIVTKTVVAPKPGIILVWTNMDLEWDANSAAGTFAGLEGRLAVDGAVVPGYDPLPHRSLVYDASEATTFGGDEESLGMNGAVAVSAGTHTVAAQLRLASGTALTHVERAFLTALYVPFGSTGGGTPRMGGTSSGQ
jgi:hypothetical protein